MEILQAAGAAERIMSKALPWTHGNSIYKGAGGIPHGIADP